MTDEATMPVPGAAPSVVPGTSLVAVQEWEGYVLEIGKDVLVARLLDITARAGREDEEATIPLDQLSGEDRARLRVGSIFRWVIGYRHSVTGAKQRVSEIAFRKSPILTQAEWDDAREWAVETRRLLGLQA